VLDWDYQVSLEEGMSATYSWIEMQSRSGLKSE
jgi:hypothetical protein